MDKWVGHTHPFKFTQRQHRAEELQNTLCSRNSKERENNLTTVMKLNSLNKSNKLNTF